MQLNQEDKGKGNEWERLRKGDRKKDKGWLMKGVAIKFASTAAFFILANSKFDLIVGLWKMGILDRLRRRVREI